MIDTSTVLASLDPKTRKRVQMASEVKVEKQLTPSVGLNLALKGGLAYGRQHLIWGNKSAGKTSFCLQLVAMAQKDGKVCAWVDCEQTFDPEWAKRLGVDIESLIIVPEIAVNRVANTCVELMQGGTDVIIVDSISTILSSAYYDDNELKDFEKTGQIGTSAKDLGKMSNMLLGVNEKTLLVLISQQTTFISPTYTKMEHMGGNKIKHNSSTVIKLFATESATEAIKEKIAVGDSLIETMVGRPVVWNVQYNKTAAMGPVGKYNFFFEGDHRLGVSRESELVKIGVLYGLIKRSGAWYSLGETTLQGESKVEEYLRNNPSVASELERNLYDIIDGSTTERFGDVTDADIEALAAD
jgi:recombination protein RecA